MARSDIESYEVVMAVEGGEALERVDFEDGGLLFLDHSCTTTNGTFKGGWDEETRRAAHVLVEEE